MDLIYYLIPIKNPEKLQKESWYKYCHFLPNVGLFVPEQVYKNIPKDISNDHLDLYPKGKSYMDLIGNAIANGFSNIPPGTKDPGDE